MTRTTMTETIPTDRRHFAAFLALFFLPLSLQAAPQAGESSQDQAPPPPVTVRESIPLITKTPLGDAVVTIPPGTPVTVAETKGDWILVKKPPFSAWIRTCQTSLAPALTGTNPLSSVPVPPQSVSSPSPSPHSPALPPKDVREIGFRLPDWIPSSLIVPGFPWHLLLLAYGGFASVLLLILFILFLRLRLTAKEIQRTPQPVVSLEAKTPPLPGFVECPLCKAPLLIESLTTGENQCPTCSGRFECE